MISADGEDKVAGVEKDEEGESAGELAILAEEPGIVS